MATLYADATNVGEGVGRALVQGYDHQRPSFLSPGNDEQQYHNQRSLFEVFGVTEDDGAYVVFIGLLLVGIAVLACFYCKIYDPTRIWCTKKWKKWCSKKERDAPPPRPRTPTEEQVQPFTKSQHRFVFIELYYMCTPWYRFRCDELVATTFKGFIGNTAVSPRHSARPRHPTGG